MAVDCVTAQASVVVSCSSCNVYNSTSTLPAMVYSADMAIQTLSSDANCQQQCSSVQWHNTVSKQSQTLCDMNDHPTSPACAYDRVAHCGPVQLLACEHNDNKQQTLLTFSQFVSNTSQGMALSHSGIRPHANAFWCFNWGQAALVL
eukprot:2984-Heterococcus_DN1.PRE.4